MCDCKRCEADRAMWAAIRRALLMAASAIAKRYDDHDGKQDQRRAA